VIDTEVEGDPAAVTAAATWLRDTLAVKVADAADHTQSARNTARGSWEGESASSYQAMTHEVVDMADKHEARVKRAAGALEDYAARLRGLETAMTGIRSRASAGGLVVDGTVIHPPAPAPAAKLGNRSTIVPKRVALPSFSWAFATSPGISASTHSVNRR
jgi:uncharacterized protein YukE